MEMSILRMLMMMDKTVTDMGPDPKINIITMIIAGSMVTIITN